MHSTIRPKSASHHTLKAAPLAGGKASIGVAFDFQELLRSTTTDTAAAIACLKTLFKTTEGPINCCVLLNSDLGSRAGAQQTSRDSTTLEKFITRNDIPKWGSYFCVSTMKSGELYHAKDNIAETPALHVDIDFKDITDKRDDVIRKLMRLGYPPSMIIDTGHGVHAYWLFKEAITYSRKPKQRAEEIERIETALKQLCDLVGGDNKVTHPAAVMRLPGTHNSKFGEWRQVVVVEQNEKCYELSDLEEWLGETSPIILRKDKPPAQTAGESNVWLKFGEQHKPPIDVEKRLEQMMYMGSNDCSIHITQLEVSSSLLSSGVEPDEVVAMLMDATRAAAGDYGKRWNWTRGKYSEENRIRNMCETWLKKHPEVKEKIERVKQKQQEEEQQDDEEQEDEEDSKSVDKNGKTSKPKFRRNKKGEISHTQRNIHLALTLLKITVRYNIFEDRAIIEGMKGFDSLNDAAMDRLWLTIDAKYHFRPTKDFFWTVIFDEARLNSFHPVREYLDGLKWDGMKRIDSWLIKYGQAKDTEYTRAVGALFLIAAVRRVRSPGAKFDEMLVLHSEQGNDKSSALAILAVKPEWFTDDLPLNSDSKKTIERLRGRWIVEAAELKGMRYGDIEHLKAFLSRTVDRARMSYDRANSELYRQCVIAGTTNHEKFLRDQTGNRRFWPVRDIKFDLKKLTRDRDQLWAEAAAREAEGVSIRLPKELWAEAGVEQNEHMISEPWIDVLHHHLANRQAKLLCHDAWLLVEVPVAQRTQVHCERLGVAMKAIGWKRQKQRFGSKASKKSKVQWAYIPEDTPKGATLPKIVITCDQWGHVEFIALQKEAKF